MCDSDPCNGDVVPDDQIVYRACLRKNFLLPDRTGVSQVAFYKMGNKDSDGLSFAATPRQAVERLNKNEGVIRVLAGAVRALNRNIEFRHDPQIPGHILLRNLPCMDKPEEMGLADAVSSELAYIAEIES